MAIWLAPKLQTPAEPLASTSHRRDSLFCRAALLLILGLHSARECVAEPTFALTRARELAMSHRHEICTAAKANKVPAGQLAAVFFAEWRGRDGADTLQDAIFALNLKVRPEAWWREWAKHSVVIVQRGIDARVRLGKWPEEVIATGMVFSLGPAQITPWAALRACENQRVALDPCSVGVSEVIKSMLTMQGALSVASAVLRNEADDFMQAFGYSVERDAARWGSLYNIGFDLYAASARKNFRGMQSNKFGRVVGQEAPHWEALLRCSGAL